MHCHGCGKREETCDDVFGALAQEFPRGTHRRRRSQKLGSPLCTGARLEGAIFESTDLTGANFGEASLTTEGDDGHITFDEGDLTRADFTEASLTTTGDDSDIDFRDADLFYAEFLGAQVDASGTLYNDPTTA